ncbi:CBO0543 family protein [Paenibacillus phocaensis]|uniref:CBO0543 family protein n=1 Tax=Paenibacillus phocaensis TaxID=1776378 RepID=UPI000839C204|nr:CBO0543 family protein [Paenibacillus phocaensis]
MLLNNIIVGFLVPWIAGAFLIYRDKKAMLLAFPSGGFMSLLFNDLGVYYKWWQLHPDHMESVTTIPFNLGIYPIVAGWMLYFIFRTRFRFNAALMIVAFTALLTGAEYVYVCLDKIHYGNGWNIGWTFLSYLLALGAVYGYTRLHARLFVSRSGQQGPSGH